MRLAVVLSLLAAFLHFYYFLFQLILSWDHALHSCTWQGCYLTSTDLRVLLIYAQHKVSDLEILTVGQWVVLPAHTNVGNQLHLYFISSFTAIFRRQKPAFLLHTQLIQNFITDSIFFTICLIVRGNALPQPALHILDDENDKRE